MCDCECNDYMMGELEAEIERYEEVIRGFEGASRADCLNIARHFAEWQGKRICAYIQGLKKEVRESIEGWEDMYGASFSPLVLARGKMNGMSIIERDIRNGRLDEEMKGKYLVEG